ncbi:MAG: PEP/pyruvate-binding domain-containing protein [Anaerolineae bacterium]
MSTPYVLSLTDAKAVDLSSSGGKGASLARLARAGLPVPGGYVVTTAAYRTFVEANDLQGQVEAHIAELREARRPSTLEAASAAIHALFDAGEIPAEIEKAIVQAYTALGDGPAVAVRSSATAEDLPELSFAGQQETFLNVRGAQAVVAAVKRCWASLWTARAIDYRLRHNVPQDAVDLAVVVQRLVVAEVAGIMFTANPVNNDAEEVVINAAWGLGEAIVAGIVSPDTIIADKGSGTVKHVEIADKDRMTVPTAAGTETRPVATQKRRARALDDAQVAELVALGRQIEEFYGTPQDIEWCWAEGEFTIVQSRPITTLRAPVEARTAEVPPPEIWEVPNRRAKYMRNNIVELIPDPMTPLFGTLGRRVINRRMNAWLADFLGKPGLMPDELIIKIHGYAYYNGDFGTKEILQILLNSVGIMKRMFTGMEARWRKADATYQTAVSRYKDERAPVQSSDKALSVTTEVLDAAINDYAALVSGLIPAAWISEGLFTLIYKALIKRRQDPPAATFLLGFDSVPILGEKSLYDLAKWAVEQPGLAQYLREAPAADIAERRAPPAGVPDASWQEWLSRFDAYLDAYGGMIYDLDFAKPTPADDPTSLIRTLKLFLKGGGTDPYARQKAAAKRRDAETEAVLGRIGGLRRKLFETHLARAQGYAPKREDGLATLGLGYPLIRRQLLGIGERLVAAGAVAKADDVFWLKEDELRAALSAVDQGVPPASRVDEVAYRRALWQARKRVTPPMSLPMPPKFIRKLFPALGGVSRKTHELVLRGTPCSPGTVTAPARVLENPADFDTMEPGDVLVAGITTPAWTPLFAMASAVVTDVGGPLSHGSIVAREYGIPAVLGTGNATRRLKTGDRVRVDGSAGTVEILSDAQSRAG